MKLPKIIFRDVGDVIDRWSISKLKAERIGNKENIREYQSFEEGRKYLQKKYLNMYIDDFFKHIYNINVMIWDLEADLRQGKLDGVLSEVGRRAIEIREHNNLRVQVKNIINKLTHTGFQDIKKNHISE